jgi:hypothetical protein
MAMLMKATPFEFAHTLRCMRPSYDVTVDYVRDKIANTCSSKVERVYQAALDVLLAQPELFK